jgi:hypothetical protein
VHASVATALRASCAAGERLRFAPAPLLRVCASVMLRNVFRTSRKRKLLEAARSGDLVAALTALDAGAAIECRDVQARGWCPRAAFATSRPRA